MFEKDKQPSPARQRQLDRYARLVDSLSPKSKMGQGLIRAFWVGESSAPVAMNATR